MTIIRSNVGFRGLSGALDMSTVTLATGAPGSAVSLFNGVLSIPQGLTGPAGTSITAVRLTGAQYDALTAGEKADASKLYLITG